ncbi:HEAT repeat domain-containing protein [Candidatus Poribacteria bacterium]|nr:HEAT repeat domain-containing protein [Candidatus Poribacteria bacterium]
MNRIDNLTCQLKVPDASVRIRAAEALGKTGDARAVEPLIAAWRDPEKDVRGTALGAVGKIGIPAIEALINALRHPEIGVRTKASCALDRIGDQIRESGDLRAVEPLIAAFGEKSHRIRTHAASTLGKLGDGRAVEPLIAELNNPKGAHVRTAEALGKLGDTSAEVPLIDALEREMNRPEPDIGVCHHVLRALERIGRPALELLLPFLQHPNANSRRKLAWLLAGFGNAKAVDLLIGMRKDPHPHVRSRVVQALSAIGDAKAVQPLIVALKDEAINVRIQALHALGKFGESAVVPLIPMLKDTAASVRRHAASELGTIGDERALPELERVATEDSDNSVRLAANSALERIQRTEHFEPIN